MVSERDYQRTVEVGQRNQEVKVLIQNWCGHARIEKTGGTGMIEAATGFPIGHHSMACDHAPAGGIATWYLEEAALAFYDRNCVNCTVRQPLRFPNLVELVGRRDQMVAAMAADQERQERKLRDELDARQKVRVALQTNAAVPVVSLIEDLQALDQTRTESASEKIIATARLAPEVFADDVVDYLFHLIESNESWAIETALSCLQIVSQDHKRLVACAMQCLSRERNIAIAAQVLLAHLDLVDASQAEAAVKSLCLLAAPPRHDFDFSEPEKRPEALQALASRFPAAVERALDGLIASQSSFVVKAAARAIPLAYGCNAYPLSLVRSLAAKLARVDSLIDIDSDSEMREVVHALERALVYAMLADDQEVDALLVNYYQGASSAGEERIAGVYSTLLRLPGNRFESVDVIPDLRPYGIALRRLLTWVTTTQNPDVLQETHEALRHFPEQLTQVACDQMELLLGTAALLDQALADVTNPPVQVSSGEASAFLAQMDRRNRRQQLACLRSAILEWASSAAAESTVIAAKFIGFIASDVQWPEQFRSALIRALPPLMHTAASTNAVLPFLYGAMVGESALVRMAAAQTLRELRHLSMTDLPSLVHDAFLLLLSDPIIGVHQSAAEALERISFPEEYEDRITEQVMAIFMAYAQGDREHDSFLVTCIELLVGRLHEKPRFAGVWGPVFVATLMKVDVAIVLRRGHSWMLTRLVPIKGFPDLLLKLLRSEERYDTYDDQLVSLLRELPKDHLLGMQAALVTLCEQRSDDWVLAAACIEVFSVVGAWDVAAKIAGHSHDILPDSTRMLIRKQYAQLSMLGIEFERHLATGNHADALECASQWRQTFEGVKRNRGEE
ncbi:hypothetical protein MRS60_26795 [Burkholderia pyrrocinia]|uniref:hypothetical protein n=1 Tax=Burkholderia pyrrocinia TaxID=60550 RepID=UPI001FB39EE0|nr:hypothetical protein [Burkholderia pyrrocinia]UOB57804.1 hypothetical protein MRS60_26795 [Burkholderia pyrrocinia]